jgi:hypothetical protein
MHNLAYRWKQIIGIIITKYTRIEQDIKLPPLDIFLYLTSIKNNFCKT